MSTSQIYYSDKYYDDTYEYRHVVLPRDISKHVPKTHLMSEAEWRSLGVQQSQGWIHYMKHDPEPHILLFRRKKTTQETICQKIYENMSAKLAPLVDLLQKGTSKDVGGIYLKIDAFTKTGAATKETWNTLPSLVSCVRKDIISKNEDTADAALRLLSGFHQDILKYLNEEKKDIFDAVMSDALCTTASSACIHDCFLNVFSEMSFECFSDMLFRVIFGEKRNISMTMKQEVLKYCTRSSTDQENQEPNIPGIKIKILQIMLSFTIDDNENVRNDAVNAINQFNLSYPIESTGVAEIMSCLKTTVIPKIGGLSKPVNSLCEVLTHQLPLFLRIIGINIKKSSSLTNALLKIMEQGFRHVDGDVKVAAFKAWDSFINCLAEDIEVLSSSRYMKLLMQPLTVIQSSEAVNIVRIKTLWGLAGKLQHKLPLLFSNVCLPILHSCLGNLEASKSLKKGLDSAAASSIKARRSSNNLNGFYAAMQASGYRATPKKASKSSQLQLIGVEALIHLLEYPDDKDTPILEKFALPALSTNFLALPATFNSNGQLLISATEEVLCCMPVLSSDYVRVLWGRLHYHIKVSLQSNLQRQKREPELFNVLLLALQNVIESESLPEKVTFDMLRSFLEFPGVILSSTFYGGLLNGVHGFPALTLLKLLFSKRLALFMLSQNSAELITCASRLLSLGFESNIRILPFCQSVLELFRSFAQNVSQQASEEPSGIQPYTEMLIILWSKLGKGLNSYITKSQEVNQGDSLDHDFSAMYMFLLFPICLDGCIYDCTETWDVVYKTFLWCSGLVTTCKPNEICSYLSTAILGSINNNPNDSTLLFLSHVSHTMAAGAEYNHRGFVKQRKSHESGSTQKRERQKIFTLERHKNLADLCRLVKILVHCMESNLLPEVCGELMKCLCQLFSSIYFSEDIRTLFQHFVPILKNLVTVSYENQKTIFEQFETIFHTVENVYKSSAIKDNAVLVLDDFHSLICNCILHKNTKFQKAALKFWENVVICSPQHEAICDSLTDEVKLHLFPVYKRMGWACPWKNTDLSQVTELSEQNLSENTQSSLPAVAGYGAFGSPVKKHSFLSPKKSSLCAVSSPVKVQVPSPMKRKLNSLSDNVDYVKCSSPFPKPRTPLTERQKEKLREREFIPPMYNELDEMQEQDIEIASQNDTECDSNSTQHDASDKSHDVIESSQTPESPRKKLRVEGLTKTIMPKKMASIAENDGENSRSSRSNSAKLGKQKNADKQNVSFSTNATSDISEEICSDRDSLHDDNMSLIRGESDQSSVMHIDSNLDIDAGLKSRSAIILDEGDDDDKDLGVTPLDDSYEYVEMVDMSIGATNITNSSGHVDGMDIDVVNNLESENVVEKLQNVSVQLQRISDETEEKLAASSRQQHKKETSRSAKKSKKNVKKKKGQTSKSKTIKDKTSDKDEADQQNIEDTDAGLTSEKNHESKSCSVAEVKQPQEVQPLRRSKRGKYSRSEDKPDAVDVENEIENQVVEDPKLMEPQGLKIADATSQKKEQNDDFNTSNSPNKHKTVDTDDKEELDDTEFEYVEVADMSIAACKNSLDVGSEDDEAMGESDSEQTANSEKTGDLPADTSEYEYVQVCDMSIAAVALETTNLENVDVEEDENTGNNDSDNYAPISTCMSSSSLISEDMDEDDDENFMDARSSLGADSAGRISRGVSESGDAFSNLAETETSGVSDTAVAIDNCSSRSDTHKCDEDIAQTNDDNGYKETENAFELANNVTVTGTESEKTVAKSITSSDSTYDATKNDGCASPTLGSNRVLPLPNIETSPGNDSIPQKISPNAKGILKRRISAAVSPSAVSPGSSNRRVSFAEPISKSQCVESTNNHFLQSPKSSLVHRKRHSPRVSRRLSLQADKIASMNENQGVASPLSLRSVKVAEAIANIRAKDSNSPSRLPKACGTSATENFRDFDNVTLGDMRDPDFVKSLTRSQCKRLYDVLHQISHDVVMSAFDT